MVFSSAAVTRLCTPATARAALTSMRLMRPCATVERKILPYSIPGRRRLCTYSARPVTLTHGSSRGTERPTCGVSAAWVARFMDRPSEIHANQVLLIGGRAGRIAFDANLPRRIGSPLDQLVVEAAAAQDFLGCGEPRRFVGRRAQDDARSLPVEHHGHAECGPVVGGTRGAFQVDGAARAHRRHAQGGDQLVARKRGLEVAGVDSLHRSGALAFRPGDGDACGKRAQERRQVHVRIAVRQVAADGRHVTHAHVRERAQRAHDDGPPFEKRRLLQRAQRDHGADLELALCAEGDLVESEPAQVDEARRPQHARLHHQHQRRAARHRSHRAIARVEHRDRFRERSRLDQFEWAQARSSSSILSMLISPRPPEEAMFRTLGAAQVEYDQHGAGAPLLLIHSLLTELTVFDLVLRRLPREKRATRINLPGFGSWSAVELGSLPEHADHVACVMAALELTQDTTVFGNGFGAFVALERAIRHGRRSGRLIVADTLAAFPEPARLPFRAMAERVSGGGMAAVLDTAIARMFPPAFAERHPQVIAARKAALAAVEPHCFARACLALASLDLGGRAAKTKNSTLVLCGALDQTTTPALARELAQRIPGARYEEIAGSGHCPMLEQPDVLVAKILAAG